MTKYVKNESDSLKYKPQSNVKIDFICDVCNTVQNKCINTVYKNGFNCVKCSDGISYPEKFVMSILNQLNLNFTHQKKIIINDKKRFFDFTIESLKIIIEVDGGFHFKTTKISDHTIVQENDLEKEHWAFTNGYSLYRINAEKSTIEHISNEFVKKFKHIFDLENVDYKLAGSFAISNLVYEVCNYKKENHELYASDISKIFNLSSATVRRYLCLGDEIGIIKYKPSDESLKRYKKLSKSIDVYKDEVYIKTYTSISLCVSNSIQDFGVKFTDSGISNVLSGRIKKHKSFNFKYN